MRKFLSYLSLITLFILGIFLLEGACFRLVENYAQFRLQLAWGEKGKGSFHEIFRKLPLDHFKLPPSSPLEEKGLSESLARENQYSSKILSFSRPTRDLFKEEVENTLDPIGIFEIRDFGPIKSIVLPGLKLPATQEEVVRKRARRIGDPMEYARGIFVVVMEKSSETNFAELFKKFETTFGFLLGRGMACAIIDINSESDLMDKVRFLQSKHPMIAKNVFAYARETSANLLLKACSIEPDLFKAVVVNDPSFVLPPPAYRGLPWFLVELGGLSASIENDRDENLLKWIQVCRDSDFLYPSRLGGLLHLQNPRDTYETSSFAISFLLEALGFCEAVGDSWPTSKPYEQREPIVANSKTIRYQTPSDVNQMDLLEVERTNLELTKGEGKVDLTVKASFDCDIVRGYREIHAGDPDLSLISNRDLVLKIGLGFEEMGEDVLKQVAERDPLFYRFYRSLRVLEADASPLN